ncbi:hypothetical protein [Pseudomonas farris]
MTDRYRPILLKKSAMVSAAEKHASEIEIFTSESGCRTQISRSSVLKRRFHRSLSWPFQKTDFFNTIGQKRSVVQNTSKPLIAKAIRIRK